MFIQILTGIGIGATLGSFFTSRKLQEEIDTLAYDPSFRVLTRQGLMRILAQRKLLKGSAIIYGDIDDLKVANSKWGHERTDTIIARALATRKSDTKVKVGRWHVGDELVWLVPKRDAIELCERVNQYLSEYGMSITFAINYRFKSVEQGVAIAQKVCHEQKEKGLKGFWIEV